MTQRNLKTYPIPQKPELDISNVDDFVSEEKLMCMPMNDFSNLTQYVIKLKGQLSKCNSQALAYN